MSETRAPERHTLTLLIQLFGREVLDRLARAGFDGEEAIAGAGPERLAAASGISLPVAQRIVAVVEEVRGGPPAPRAKAQPAFASSSRPGRRKPPASRAPIKVAIKEKTAAPVKTVPAPTEPADQDEAFVDDVALVTWMGFSSKTPSGRLSFSVADRILDPVRPAPDPPEAAPAPEEAAVPQVAVPVAVPAGGNRTLPGSFWSFGGQPGSDGARDATDRSSGRPSGSQAPAGTAGRRDRDDH